MMDKYLRGNEVKSRGRVKKVHTGGLAVLTESALFLRIVECAARFLAAWLLAGAEIFGGCAPFTAGFVAVSGSGVEGVSALLGTILGAVMRGGVERAVRYGSVALLIFTASAVFKGFRWVGRPWFMPLVTAGMALCTGAVYAAGSGWQAEATAFYIIEVLFSAVGAYFYRLAFAEAVTREQQRRRRVSMAAAACTLFIALAQVELAGVISVGRTAAVVCVLAAASKGGAVWGAVSGVMLGVALDAAAGTPVFTAALSCAGVAAGLFAGHGRLPGTVVYILVNAAALVWRGGDLALAALYETFLASVVFMVLPEKLLLRAREEFLYESMTGGKGEEMARAYLRKRAALAAEAFAAVYELLDTAGAERQNREGNILTVFDAAAERKCIHCAERDRCYGREYEQTKTAQNDAVVRMVMRGELLPEDLPDYFRAACRDVPGLVRIVNEEYEQLLRRRERLNRAGESYELLCGRFLDMSDVFSGFSEQLQPMGSAEKEAEERLSLYLSGKGLDLSCGVFRDGNGRMHIELEGNGLSELKHLPDWLDKLAVAVGKPLCEMETEGSRRQLSLLEAEPLAVRIGVASMRREGESVSGDKGAYFKTDSGQLYVILSDGMGSGSGAARDSSEVITLLEKFLRAGVSAENAMRLLGAALQMKNEKTLASASIDLLSVNLFSGAAEIFKFGAAPTFVKGTNGVSVLQGESLAAGMRGASENLPDRFRTRLDAGSTAVIVSDGVSGGEDVAWLAGQLAEEKAPGREFARRILEEAGQRFGCTDDMTVITVNVERR